MSDLDTRLARERADLLDAIEQPPLARIGAKAAARRRHRRAGRAGVALVAVAAVAVLGLRPWAGEKQPPAPAEDRDTPGVVYTDAGITINGLTGDPVFDPEGHITDVEFTDPDHGYALIQCPASSPCDPSLARTEDGGLTWAPLMLQVSPSDPNLIAFPDGQVIGGVVKELDGPIPETVKQDELLRLGRDGIEVWTHTYIRGLLKAQPPNLEVSWVATTPTADGAWWVGGLQGGTPAVAVTRDRGRTWTVTPLGVAGARAQVAVLGAYAYATVLGQDGSIRAIFKSTDFGRHFTRTTSDPIHVPALSGELVPLLDGRLLMAGDDHRWYVSEDGKTFDQADGTLPAVGRLVHTPAGYVAYDLFNAGWAAYSADGSTWRKLQLN